MLCASAAAAWSGHSTHLTALLLPVLLIGCWLGLDALRTRRRQRRDEKPAGRSPGDVLPDEESTRRVPVDHQAQR
jgi:Flp pilus assembly protein protease CpaA